MIHYHGGPITPDTVAATIWSKRHAFISFAHPSQVTVAADVCQSFALDNGAYSFWKAGKETSWSKYYTWVADWKRHPGCDFAIIPDVVDGGEAENDSLLAEWPHGAHIGVPVFHLHESLDRCYALAKNYPRMALGSSGVYSTPGSELWRNRMEEIMNCITDAGGMPLSKIHGLRMLNPKVFVDYPLASADSTNIARNVGIDKKWKGTYTPASKASRGLVMADRIEAHTSAHSWGRTEPVKIVKECLLAGGAASNCGLCGGCICQ